MPDSFATILRTQDLVPEVFICPRDDARAAKDAANFHGNERECSYIYVGDGMPMPGVADREGADVLVAFDRPDTHEGDGVNALFGDGHVEWMEFAPADGPIARGWRRVQAQIARGDRPVRWVEPATRPDR